MSSHYVFEVHVKTPGEDDDEAIVEALGTLMRNMAALFSASLTDLEVDVYDVRRT